jgi:prepilin-type N-terminal cleavage/methylation domain-containing protein
MNIDPSPIRRRTSNRQAAFSLIEMIGVLAIIAILAVVIVPKVFSTIASSRVTNAVGSVTSMKTAVTEFAGKYGTIPTTNNRGRIDDLLYTAGMLDGRFQVKIGTQPANPPIAGATWARSNGSWAASGGSNQNSQSRLICRASNTTNPSTAAGSNFRLDGTNNLPSGARVISAAIVNVTAAEAQELSLRLDSEAFTPATASVDDVTGKVVYRRPNGQGLTTAYVYIAHQ